jgi:hypothetical protein
MDFAGKGRSEMTDTAKPTPGPWHGVHTSGGAGETKIYSSDMGLPVVTVNSCWPHRESDAALIAEAGTVFHETGLTPRQLLEQRNALHRELDDALLTIKSVRATIEHLEAALAKNGEQK